MYEENYRQLGAAIGLQAVKDYAVETPAMQKKIIKDLRSEYMELITQGASVFLAEKLETDPDEIIDRVRKMENI